MSDPCVLVVESCPRARRDLMIGLAKAGITSRGVADGLDALDELARDRTPIRLVVANLDLPTIGGLALARHMSDCDMRVAVVTYAGIRVALPRAKADLVAEVRNALD